jgi:hypothetical protein
MAEIKIKSRTNNLGFHFNVELTDQNGFTSHRVTMDRDFIMRIGADYEPEVVVRKSFEFLLSKEPKEKILEEFDLTVISHYFPEYVTTLEKMLESNPT